MINKLVNINTAFSYSRFHFRLKYTVSQKNLSDIFDCNLKTNYHILIIFGSNIPDTTCQQKTI